MNAARQLRLRKKKRSLITVPIASMGDIAFLLIIFFIVCSNFTRETAVRINPAVSSYAEVIENARVSVTIDADGVLYLQGVVVPNVEAVEWGVAALISGATDDMQRLVLFRCDQSVPREVFQPVIEAIASAGGLIAAVGEPVPVSPLAPQP